MESMDSSHKELNRGSERQKDLQDLSVAIHLTLIFNGVTCVSISALVVDAHSVLAQQELHHLQVFSIGTCTMEEIQP